GELDSADGLGLFLSRRFAHFITDLIQLAGVEPKAAAPGTFIHFDPSLGAEMAAHELHIVASRTGALAVEVHTDARVAFNLDQPFTGGLVRLVHLLQFEGIEPDPATTTPASVHGQ